MFFSGNNARRWRGLTTRFGSCLALVALLAVFTASYWHGPHGTVHAAAHGHHHDHEDGHRHGERDQDPGHEEHSCPVCVAVHSPVSDALPESVPGVLRLEFVALVVVDDEVTGAVLPLRVGWARGPPVMSAVV